MSVSHLPVRQVVNPDPRRYIIHCFQGPSSPLRRRDDELSFRFGFSNRSRQMQTWTRRTRCMCYSTFRRGVARVSRATLISRKQTGSPINRRFCNDVIVLVDLEDVSLRARRDVCLQAVVGMFAAAVNKLRSNSANVIFLRRARTELLNRR